MPGWHGLMGAGLNDLTFDMGAGRREEGGYAIPQYLQYGKL